MSTRLDLALQRHPDHEEGIRLLASRDPSRNATTQVDSGQEEEEEAPTSSIEEAPVNDQQDRKAVPRGTCRIEWCADSVDSDDGWCWTHLVLAYLDKVPMPEKDRLRVEKVLLGWG